MSMLAACSRFPVEGGIFDRVASLSIMSNGSSIEGSGSTKQSTKKNQRDKVLQKDFLV